VLNGDEPFVSLDDALAAKLRAELVELASRRPVTTPRIGRRAEEIAAIRSMIELRVDQG
jgi:ABC-type sulfate/molybdate transport systems ATPase subunit